jgi:cytochrome c-type biogenesis protein
VGLLSVYSLGLALPFLIISVFIHFVLAFIRRANKLIRYVNVTAGILLMLMGALLLTNKMHILGM